MEKQVNKPVENRITTLELEIENLHRRLDEHAPIVADYGNRNIVFRVIAVMTLVNLLLLLLKSV